MKKKIISIFLCFTIILSSFNLSFADSQDSIVYPFDFEDIKPLAFPGIVLAPEIIATIGSIAVGAGIVLTSDDDIYDIARLVYDNYQGQKENIETIFKISVAIGTNGVVKVGKEFLDICKSAFDIHFKNVYDGQNRVMSSYGLYEYSINGVVGSDFSVYYNVPCIPIHMDNISVGDFIPFNAYIDLEFVKTGTVSSHKYKYFDVYINDVRKGQFTVHDNYKQIKLFYNKVTSCLNIAGITSTQWQTWGTSINLSGSNDFSIPYEGGYTWDNIDSNKNEDESVGIYVPGNSGSLVGQVGGSTVQNGINNPSYDLPFGGVVTVPDVDNPSIGLGDSITIPGVVNPPVDVPGDDVINPPVDVPNDGIWATIKDFIISLVVPSDSFWTDTWNDLYNNFTGSFPGVDMGGFNDLVTGEKKFPNIDINIMGVKGRVVNGDVINSIVDWLRPIIAGFMMLCLMFFNYRKIYKLIRNSEPFGGIAPGTSDFSTGISEYSDNYIKAKEIIGDTMRGMAAKGGK